MNQPNPTPPSATPARDGPALTAAEWSRLMEWARDPNRKPPALAFTAGSLRDMADSVLEAVKAFAPQSEPASQPAAVEASAPSDYEDRTEPPAGLYNRYIVSKSDGTPIDPRAVYFVLRLDDHGDDKGHIEACREAAKRWCEAAPANLGQVAHDLFELIYAMEHGKPPAPEATC